MKIGMNMFLWTTHVTQDHAPVLRELKAAGYDGVDVPAQGMYDTFHANVEEKDLLACVVDSLPCVGHVHILENDRGTPGRGHIPFNQVLATSRSAGYDSWLTIEAFSRSLPGLAAAAKVRRDFFPSPDEVGREGIDVIRKGWSAAR